MNSVNLFFRFSRLNDDGTAKRKIKECVGSKTFLRIRKQKKNVQSLKSERKEKQVDKRQRNTIKFEFSSLFEFLPRNRSQHDITCFIIHPTIINCDFLHTFFFFFRVERFLLFSISYLKSIKKQVNKK